MAENIAAVTGELLLFKDHVLTCEPSENKLNQIRHTFIVVTLGRD